MAKQLISVEMRRLILKVIFLGKPPAILSLGLSTQSFAVEPTTNTVLSSELSVSGYRRLGLTHSDWILRNDPLRVETDNPVFANISGRAWPTLHSWFLLAEIDNEVALLAFGDVLPDGKGIVLLPEDKLELPISVVFE